MQVLALYREYGERKKGYKLKFLKRSKNFLQMTFGDGYTQILGSRTSLVRGVICGNLCYYKLWHPQRVCNIGFWMGTSRWNIQAGRDRSVTHPPWHLQKLTDCSSVNESYTRSCLLVDYFFHYSTAVVWQKDGHNTFYGCELSRVASTDHHVWYQSSRRHITLTCLARTVQN